MWREKVAEHPDRVKEMWAHSPSMDRDVPLFVITAKDNSQPRPTIYLLNGADGGEGKANWVMQTDVVDFYMDKNVNVVIPMSGQFSYYTDWEQENANLGGKQKWETFLTKELPGPLEKTLKASDKRAIVGMSMTGTTSLLYAEHYPGFYDAVGAFSGCAQTSEGLPLQYVRVTLDRGQAVPEQMWGPLGTEKWAYNDALINAEKLRGTPLYVSNASGLAGQSDLWSSPRTGTRSPAARSSAGAEPTGRARCTARSWRASAWRWRDPFASSRPPRACRSKRSAAWAAGCARRCGARS